MYAWGSTVNGELGLGGIEEEIINAPVVLPWPSADQVIDVACGYSHTLLLTNDGKVASCGSNDYGQLGHDKPRKRPQAVTKLDDYEIVEIACGVSHSMALNSWGQVYTWGSNSFGQLGIKGSNMLGEPKLVKALTQYNIVQIACGQRHSIALTNSGEILSWGSNTYGQLGIGTSSNLETNPTLLSSLSGIPISFIACGANHAFAISKSGAVFGWGKNINGQLGLNDTVSKLFPCQLRSLRSIRVRYISCGEDFSTFLTMDGGVFTCGLGSCGQLGHGGTSNEMLPRKVSELMGSTITQIQCGRQHTLALIPSRGRVYSFGLGGAGQLGRQRTGNASTPQIVFGPWVTASQTSLGTDALPPEVSVFRIFAGGDHCFARVNPIDSLVIPLDSRELLARTQILTIQMDKITTCLQLNPEAEVDQDIITYLETVFKSLACLNGSFLLDSDDHYHCTSKHHGLNLVLAEEVFNMIAKIENDSVKHIILNSITGELMPTLSASPPDVEVLRIYLLLPFYHEFNNPKRHLKLQRPFANAVLRLKDQARRVIGSWWSGASPDYFEKLVNMFKSVASYLIMNQNIHPNGVIQVDDSLIAVLNLLEFLNKLNHSADSLKVPYDTFNMTDLLDYLDIRIDYVSWLTDSTNRFYLCSYPFIFDAQAKTRLLQTDQAIQMESAMQDAARNAVMTLLMNPMPTLNSLNQYLQLDVSRDRLVDDALCQLRMQSSIDLKKPLKVKFRNEEAEDAGGVRKEFFLLLLREILDPKYGMFKEYEETRSIWFSQDSLEDAAMFSFIGQICGLAIYNFTIIDIPFPLVLYKKLLNEHVGLADMKGLSPIIANSLQSLLDYTESDIGDVFGLNFEVTREAFGELKSIQLKPHGENIIVTQENKQEYVNLYIDYIFNTSVAAQYEAFSNGFMKVCGGRVLTLFHSHELMAVVVGNENYDWHALEECAQYKNGYKSSDQVIRWFWEVLHDMPLAEKKKFLLYLTGSDRIPIQGMKDIKITIQPTTDDKYLPVAHTCFNLLDLPRYRTKERLKYKLLQAIQQTQGFSLV